MLLGGAGLLLVGAICAYFRLGLVLSVLIEVLVFGAMREERLRRALAEARDARNELRLAIDTIPTIVWTTSPDGTVNFVNRAWRDFTGLSAEQAARGGWLDTLHPEEADLVQATRGAAIAAGRPYELDVRLRHADGTYRWVLRRSVPLRDQSGRIVQWYGTGTDIDDLKRAEAALRESEAFLAEAQRLSRTGSFGWDLSRSELRWSEETFRIFEYSCRDEAPTVEHVLRRVHPDDLDTVRQAIDRVTHDKDGWDLSRSELRWSEETFRIFEYSCRDETPTIEHVLRRVHPDDLDTVRQAIDRVTHDKEDWDLDHRLLMPDGRVKYVHVVARAARHPSGVEFVGAVMDVTATRQAQQAARRARERALAARFTAALEERTRLAREIHDTLLQGFTGVALQLTAVAHRSADPGTVAALGEVIGQAQRTLDDARQAVWDLRAPSPSGNLAEAVRETAEQAVRGTDLTLELEVSGAPYPVAARVEAAVARVLQESIANTVRHAEARSVWVRLRYTPRALRLTVRDDGKGFPVDPEFRGYGGHWGLLGMRERAAELQGSLRVESAPDCGTAVALRVPRLRAPAAET